MARKQIVIHHPTSSNPPHAPNFVAYGDAVGVQNLVGLVLHPKRGVIAGTTLVGPPHWGVFFEKVPNGDCILLVFDPLDWTTLAFAPFTLKVARVLKLNGGNISINSPASGDTVCSTFIAYGGCDVLTVSGTMTDSAGNVTNGVTIQQGKATWAIQFTINPPFNNPYTLQVTGPGGASASVSNLTVVAC
jgi:hypothetical protein